MKKTFSISWILFFFIFIITPVFAQDEPFQECTVLIAGKKTTVNGSILFGKTEDDSQREVDYLWYVPRKTYKPADVVQLVAGGTIPQVKETYAYLWDECPGTSYSNMVVNEWGVAFGSNGCVSREDPVDVVEARGDLINGGLGFRLRFILAERCKTAREAVELAAKLLDKYGYNASGRNLNIVGPNEAWQLQMVRGKQYVARRVQDDEVAIIANTFSIHEVNINDRENFICSPDLIDYAVKRGWYNPESGKPFDFAKAYAPEKVRTNPSNTRRQWNLARLLNKNFSITWQEAQTGIMPVSVKPDHKLSTRDIMTILRNHYEGTDLDKSYGYKKSPHKTPYTICNYTTHRTTVIEERSWLPPAIGTLIWRALDQPCSSVFVPWYLGATRIPQAFHMAPESFYTTKKNLLDFHFNVPNETWKLNMESASSVFALLGEMVDKNYSRTIEYVRSAWNKFETQAFSLQPAVEETALKLYKKDPFLAGEFLDLYSSGQALKSLEIAKKLINEIKKNVWGSRNPIKVRKGKISK